MSDNDDNVISINFGARREEENDPTYLQRNVQPLLESTAKKRGFSPDRAAELATLIHATATRMFAYHVNVTTKVPESPLDYEAFGNEVAKAIGQQVAAHCVKEIALAVIETAYPLNR